MTSDSEISIYPRIFIVQFVSPDESLDTAVDLSQA